MRLAPVRQGRRRRWRQFYPAGRKSDAGAREYRWCV